MARILSGNEVSGALTDRLAARCAALREAGVQPALAVLRCGDSASDLSYIRGLMKKADALGIALELTELAADSTPERLMGELDRISLDSSVHGCLMLRPLPGALKERQEEIIAHLCPEKDVDGMTEQSQAGVYLNRPLGFAPCTPEAVLELLDYYGIGVSGRRVTVLGRSLVVGRPLALLLLHRNATVTVCHRQTADVAGEARRADILVSALGRAGFVTKDFLRPGQVLVDVSVNWDPNKLSSRGTLGALTGDAVFAEAESVAEAVTPVPGGVGAVTNTVLMRHVIEAAERAAGKAL